MGGPKDRLRNVYGRGRSCGFDLTVHHPLAPLSVAQTSLGNVALGFRAFLSSKVSLITAKTTRGTLIQHVVRCKTLVQQPCFARHPRIAPIALWNSPSRFAEPFFTGATTQREARIAHIPDHTAPCAEPWLVPHPCSETFKPSPCSEASYDTSARPGPRNPFA